MTHDELKNEIEGLKAKRERLQTDLILTEGALQAFEFVLARTPAAAAQAQEPDREC